jgi:hypothetical protein
MASFSLKVQVDNTDLGTRSAFGKIYPDRFLPRIGDTVEVTPNWNEQELIVEKVIHYLDLKDVEVFTSPIEVNESQFRLMRKIFQDQENWAWEKIS